MKHTPQSSPRPPPATPFTTTSPNKPFFPALPLGVRRNSELRDRIGSTSSHSGSSGRCSGVEGMLRLLAPLPSLGGGGGGVSPFGGVEITPCTGGGGLAGGW
eukprot:751183-Rhodomonas_salina.6